MKVFERAVAENGFAACARELDISPAAAIRLIGDLGLQPAEMIRCRIALRPAPCAAEQKRCSAKDAETRPDRIDAASRNSSSQPNVLATVVFTVLLSNPRE